MDEAVVAALHEAGFAPTAALQVRVELAEDHQPVPAGDMVLVGVGPKATRVRLQPIRALWVGCAQPPDFSAEPPAAYLPFFELIERTAIAYCIAVGRLEWDREFADLYRQLRRRPDNSHPNPLYSYLRAACRLYMSLHDVSQAEFEAVVGRLSASGRNFALGYGSTHYMETLLGHYPSEL